MGEARPAPGLFGKLPSHGDFLVRRLPPAVRLCFDHWLQEGLVQSRIDLGEAWLPTWLGSPLWRFVVAAGVCGEQAWAGVMMPSHDRVGRCFPLLLMAAADATPSLADCLTLHAGWFARLEAMALSTLEEGFSLEAFDDALMAAGSLPAGACAAGSGARPAGQAGLPSVRLFAGAKMSAGTGGVLEAGTSAWWTDGSHQVAPCLATCSGLPPRRAFAALLEGRWAERGWRII
jgi:type VI secretion system protein ImpM